MDGQINPRVYINLFQLYFHCFISLCLQFFDNFFLICFVQNSLLDMENWKSYCFCSCYCVRVYPVMDIKVHTMRNSLSPDIRSQAYPKSCQALGQVYVLVPSCTETHRTMLWTLSTGCWTPDIRGAYPEAGSWSRGSTVYIGPEPAPGLYTSPCFGEERKYFGD